MICTVLVASDLPPENHSNCGKYREQTSKFLSKSNTNFTQNTPRAGTIRAADCAHDILSGSVDGKIPFAVCLGEIRHLSFYIHSINHQLASATRSWPQKIREKKLAHAAEANRGNRKTENLPILACPSSDDRCDPARKTPPAGAQSRASSRLVAR